jgi:prolyl-tRNA synthetase
MVCPPKLAPTHIVILPVTHKPEERDRVLAWCKQLQKDLRNQVFAGGTIRVDIDDRDLRGGDKIWQWIKKGVPLRVEVGPRDIDKDAVFVGRRDKAPKDKSAIARADFVAGAAALLQEMQDALYARALAFQTQHTRVIDSKEEFYAYFTAPAQKDANAPTPIHAGFAMTHFCGDRELEAKIKDDLSVTVRCIPLDGQGDATQYDVSPGVCPFTGKPSSKRVVWAKSY